MIQQEDPLSGQTQSTCRVIKRFELILTVTEDDPTYALRCDNLIQIQITDPQGIPLQGGNSLRSITLSTVNGGILSERLNQSPEETDEGAFAHAIARWQLEGALAFGHWLEGYEEDSCSGIFSEQQIAQYGFPLPERSADAVWYVPDALTEHNVTYLVDPVQWEWWQEDGVVLGIEQANDSVTGNDHFTWYRIPIGDIARRLREQDNSFYVDMQATLTETKPLVKTREDIKAFPERDEEGWLL